MYIAKMTPMTSVLWFVFPSLQEEPMSIIELNINVEVALGDQVLKICDQIAHQCVNVYSTVFQYPFAKYLLLLLSVFPVFTDYLWKNADASRI